jgi:hypothetical protein
MPRIHHRPMQPGDRRFVVASWTSSYRRSPHAGLIDDDDWWAVMSAQVEKVLARPGVRVVVAADPTETDGVADLFGYLVWEPPAPTRREPLVFYCYVKQGYRWDPDSKHNPRIASGLFKAAGIDPRAPFLFVCNTQAVTYLSEAGKLPRATWRPLLGRNFKPRDHGREDD